MRQLTGSGLTSQPRGLFRPFQRESTRLVTLYEPAEFGGQRADLRLSFFLLSFFLSLWLRVGVLADDC